MISYNETYRALQTFQNLLGKPNNNSAYAGSYSLGKPELVMIHGIGNEDIEAVLLAPPQIKHHNIGRIGLGCGFRNFDIYDSMFLNEQSFVKSKLNPSFAFVMMRPERECVEDGYSHPRILFAHLIGTSGASDNPMQVREPIRHPRTNASCPQVYCRVGDHYTDSFDIDSSSKDHVGYVTDLLTLLQEKGLSVPDELFNLFKPKRIFSNDARKDRSVSARTYPKHPPVSKHRPVDFELFKKINQV